MDRRNFIKICGSALALAARAPDSLAVQYKDLQRYDRVKLVTADGTPLQAGDLEIDKTGVFFYPFVSTPCYLIRLGTLTQPAELHDASGNAYAWSGGSGSDGRIVAFSAICSHLFTHPTKEISFINYHAEADDMSGRQNVITCCAHGSVFDPAQGARVISGPASQPLTTIALEHDKESDHLYAVGTYGGEVFQDFFKSFRKELNDQFGRGQWREVASKTAVVQPLEEYTRHPISC